MQRWPEVDGPFGCPGIPFCRPPDPYSEVAPPVRGKAQARPPLGFLAGREVQDLRLTFRDGRVVDASASKNEPYLIEMLDQDAGARALGECAIGTNYSIKQYTRNTLFDEKIGGTCHLALGSTYPETGGKNTSGLHWDMVCDLREGGSISADGKVFHKNGDWLF